MKTSATGAPGGLFHNLIRTVVTELGGDPVGPGRIRIWPGNSSAGAHDQVSIPWRDDTQMVVGGGTLATLNPPDGAGTDRGDTEYLIHIHFKADAVFDLPPQVFCFLNEAQETLTVQAKEVTCSGFLMTLTVPNKARQGLVPFSWVACGAHSERSSARSATGMQDRYPVPSRANR